jgi:hypothetical protein
MECAIHCDANARLALTHTECTAEFNLISDAMLGDQILKLLYDLTRALDVAGTADTNYYFQHTHNLALLIEILFIDNPLR